MISQPSLAGAHAPSADDNLLLTLIKRIASGSQADVATFFDETSERIFTLVVRIMGDRIAAEEILLDIYVQVWQQAAQYNPDDERPLTWLSRLARQEALAALCVNGRPHAQAAMPGPEMTVVPGGATATTQSLRDALDSLPAEQAQALEMAYFGGLNCRQIAVELRLAPSLIQRHVGLAMKSICQLSEAR